mmetsp:Transcript_141226/g.451135  ORF Transcript_141226/g.451135 Transcript_141226/m.451135 type:complete len:153 (-) Transcript_141226:427-885(-)
MPSMLALLPHAFVFAALCSSAWAAGAPAKTPVAVTGSTGKLGRRAVQQLVEQVSSIPHESVAQLCVRCFDYPNAARSTLCAMTAPGGEGASSWEPLLSKVSADRRKFPGDELFKSHVFAVFVGGVLLASFAVGLLVGAFSLIRSLLPSLGGI